MMMMVMMESRLVMVVVVVVAIAIVQCGWRRVGASPSRGIATESEFCPQIIAPFSLYSCREYQVSTFDGYILTLQKIVRKKLPMDTIPPPDKLKTILFIHPGLFGGGDMWFEVLRTNVVVPLPFALADVGYEIWIANLRASRWSFGHAIFTPMEMEYWDWSLNFLATYDFPSIVEFIYGVNNYQPLQVVSYSMGCRMVMASASYNNAVTPKIKSLIMIAPLIFMRHVDSMIFKTLRLSRFAQVSYEMGAGRFSFSLFSDIFPSYINQTMIKEQLITSLTGQPCCTKIDATYNYLSGPSSFTSFKTMAHMTQGMIKGGFQAFDYGSPAANIRKYNKTQPPIYDIKKIPKSIQLILVYGGADKLAPPIDVRNISNILPNRPKEIYLKQYSHLDLIFSRTVHKDVNEPLIKMMASIKP